MLPILVSPTGAWDEATYIVFLWEFGWYPLFMMGLPTNTRTQQSIRVRRAQKKLLGYRDNSPASEVKLAPRARAYER